jgi:hypothetical protein
MPKQQGRGRTNGNLGLADGDLEQIIKLLLALLLLLLLLLSIHIHRKEMKHQKSKAIG